MGELGSVAMCKRIFKEQTTEQGDVPFYKIGTFGGTPDAFISRELFDEYKRLYQFPKVGDILISAAGTIGRTIVYQGDPAYYQDSNIVWLQHDERLDNGFLLQFLNGKSWSSLEGSTLKRLYNKDLLNAEIAIPSPDEQHQIGSTFAKLDDIITLHQRKCQYRGLYGHLSWEQRKLGDCFEFLKNNTLSRADLNGANGTARNVHYGDILIKFGDCLDGEQSDLPFITDDTVLPKFAESILREGDVIFADTAEDEAAGKCVELRKLPKEPTISGLHTIPARPRFPFGTGYLGHYLNSDAYHRQLLPLMQGIKVISVSKAALQDTQVRFPSLSEQSAIGVALSEIDNLITLHQRQSNGKAYNIIILSRTKNRQLDIAKSAVLGLETRGNSRKLLNEHPIQQRFLDIP